MYFQSGKLCVDSDQMFSTADLDLQCSLKERINLGSAVHGLILGCTTVMNLYIQKMNTLLHNKFIHIFFRAFQIICFTEIQNTLLNNSNSIHNYIATLRSIIQTLGLLIPVRSYNDDLNQILKRPSDQDQQCSYEKKSSFIATI